MHSRGVWVDEIIRGHYAVSYNMRKFTEKQARNNSIGFACVSTSVPWPTLGVGQTLVSEQKPVNPSIRRAPATADLRDMCG